MLQQSQRQKPGEMGRWTEPLPLQTGDGLAEFDQDAASRSRHPTVEGRSAQIGNSALFTASPRCLLLSSRNLSILSFQMDNSLIITTQLDVNQFRELHCFIFDLWSFRFYFEFCSLEYNRFVSKIFDNVELTGVLTYSYMSIRIRSLIRVLFFFYCSWRLPSLL